MRIAVTTTDGVKANQHFGKASSFNIYDLKGGVLKMVDLREVESYCECVNNEPVNPDHKFSSDRFSKVTERLNDCDKLYTQQIGNIPREQLKIVGIDVHECNCEIEKIPTCKGNCK